MTRTRLCTQIWPNIGDSYGMLEGRTFNPVLHWTETGLFYFINPTPGHLNLFDLILSKLKYEEIYIVLYITCNSPKFWHISKV